MEQRCEGLVYHCNYAYAYINSIYMKTQTIKRHHLIFFCERIEKNVKNPEEWMKLMLNQNDFYTQ